MILQVVETFFLRVETNIEMSVPWLFSFFLVDYTAQLYGDYFKNHEDHWKYPKIILVSHLEGWKNPRETQIFSAISRGYSMVISSCLTSRGPPCRCAFCGI